MHPLAVQNYEFADFEQSRTCLNEKYINWANIASVCYSCWSIYVLHNVYLEGFHLMLVQRSVPPHARVAGCSTSCSHTGVHGNYEPCLYVLEFRSQRVPLEFIAINSLILYKPVRPSVCQLYLKKQLKFSYLE